MCPLQWVSDKGLFITQPSYTAKLHSQVALAVSHLRSPNISTVIGPS